jgi:hypothetical protein
MFNGVISCIVLFNNPCVIKKKTYSHFCLLKKKRKKHTISIKTININTLSLLRLTTTG